MADTTSTFKNLLGLQHVGSFVRCTTMDAGRDLLLVATDTDIHLYTQHMKLKGSHHLGLPHWVWAYYAIPNWVPGQLDAIMYKKTAKRVTKSKDKRATYQNAKGEILYFVTGMGSPGKWRTMQQDLLELEIRTYNVGSESEHCNAVLRPDVTCTRQRHC